MHALDQQQFRRYAASQISMAEQMLTGHQPAASMFCSCGNRLPCSIAEHATATHEHYLSKLAVLDATVLLPVLAAAAADLAGPVPLWRSWLRRVWR